MVLGLRHGFQSCGKLRPGDIGRRGKVGFEETLGGFEARQLTPTGGDFEARLRGFAG
jgi:hypothetical protein